jgi:pimeloyl-ACP methyl ester carboxylesterase
MIYNNGDIELNYEILGEGAPIIMLNGYFNDLGAWKGCMEPILKNNPNYKRIYLDYPGSGGSKVSEAVKSWKDLFQLILKFIDSVIPGENFIIAGHSFGGFLARGILKERFELVEGILLTCPVVKPRLEKRNIDKKISHRLNLSEDKIKKIKARINREVIKSQKNTDKRYLKELRANSIQTEYDFDALESPFLKPALIIAGRQDTVVGYKDLYGILDNFPRASLLILDNGKHDIQIEQEEMFTSAVSEWLMRVEEYRACNIKPIDITQIV